MLPGLQDESPFCVWEPQRHLEKLCRPAQVRNQHLWTSHITSCALFREECTERPVTKEIQKCAKVIKFGFHLWIGESSVMYCKGQVLMTQKSELSHFQFPSWIHETSRDKHASKESKTQNVSTSGPNQSQTRKECWWSVTSGQDELFGASDDIKEADGLVPLICLPNAISTPRIKCTNIGWSFLQIPYHWLGGNCSNRRTFSSSNPPVCQNWGVGGLAKI